MPTARPATTAPSPNFARRASIVRSVFSALASPPSNSPAGASSASTTRPIWSSPLLASNRVIVAGQTGELVALNARTGEVEKTVNLGGPTLIGPIAANGTIYVVTDEAQLIALR